MDKIEILSIKGRETAETIGDAIRAAIRHDAIMQPAMGTSIHLPDGVVYDLRDTLWVVGGETAKDRDYGHVYDENGEAWVSWCGSAQSTPLCGDVEVYDDHDEARAAAYGGWKSLTRGRRLRCQRAESEISGGIS